MKVGFIGLGAMGSAMAERLVAAGHEVRAWNRSRGPAEALAKKGATVVASAAEAFSGDAVVTMLANDEAVRAVMIEGGVLNRAPKGVVHIVMATISLELGKALAIAHKERGIAYLAAPVLGRPDAAAGGRLQILAAGDPDAIARVQPLFDAMGQKTWPLGTDPAIANVAKLACNFTLACAIETMAEASALADASGLDPAKLIELLTGTLFAAPAYKTYGALITEGKFEPALFRLMLGLKDVRLALAAGEAAGVPLPFASVVRDNLVDAVGHGDGERDWSALARVARRRAGLKT